MSYTSDVRSLIYGDPVKMNEFLIRRQPLLLGDVTMIRDKRITRYRANVEHLSEGALDREIEILDLNGRCWKWYANIPAVSDWYRFMYDADSEGLRYEFLRIGELIEDSPMDLDYDASDGSLGLLEVGLPGLSKSIDRIGEDISLFGASLRMNSKISEQRPVSSPDPIT